MSQCSEVKFHLNISSRSHKSFFLIIISCDMLFVFASFVVTHSQQYNKRAHTHTNQNWLRIFAMTFVHKNGMRRTLEIAFNFCRTQLLRNQMQICLAIVRTARTPRCRQCTLCVGRIECKAIDCMKRKHKPNAICWIFVRELPAASRKLYIVRVSDCCAIFYLWPDKGAVRNALEFVSAFFKTYAHAILCW